MSREDQEAYLQQWEKIKDSVNHELNRQVIDDILKENLESLTQTFCTTTCTDHIVSSFIEYICKTMSEWFDTFNNYSVGKFSINSNHISKAFSVRLDQPHSIVNDGAVNSE